MVVGQKNVQSLRNNDSYILGAEEVREERMAHGAFQVGESIGFYRRKDEKCAWEVSSTRGSTELK